MPVHTETKLLLKLLLSTAELYDRGPTFEDSVLLSETGLHARQKKKLQIGIHSAVS